ncbi:hypothetical protein JCM21714_4350 [Gracilibacillus boraciitolerans JCM 21714]|uniref:DUF3231 family protein n=1 Tax=Gracilibacillus boraciitolerans JCM 21714 TaxID=1298598 RepID=W4VQP3_9BACI|nr:DUF3231 family protein [Gracilibacillus boraciitolerans]GAE95139.1 hypothetical protein JCM21714_4350 [Gracilibacillus boraciitolerans JCM 21714]
MGILSGDPKKQPLHYGEVFSIWSYLLAAKGNYAAYQTFLNHCGDDDLKKQLEDGISQIKQESEKVEEILKVNGIALPPAPPERSYATLEDIPVGARFNDPEISAALSGNIAKSLVACSTIIGQSQREDIAMLFGQFHMNQAQAGAKMLRLNKEKGWLLPPPPMHTNIPTKQ